MRLIVSYQLAFSLKSVFLLSCAVLCLLIFTCLTSGSVLELNISFMIREELQVWTICFLK